MLIYFISNYIDSFDKNQKRKAGISAQHTINNVPEAVVEGDATDKSYGDEGFELWSMQADQIIPYLVAAIQELNNKIEGLIQ